MKNIFVLSTLATALFAVFAFTSSVNGYEPGAVAIDFKLKNIDGNQISLSDFKTANGFIVVFTCNHCPFAKAYEDRIIELDKVYKAKGYPVIAINSNDSASYPEDSWPEMVNRAKSKKFSFPYLYDASQDIARTYGALKTPHIYLLKKEAEGLKVMYTGAIDNNSEDASKVTEKYLENALNEILSGKEVSVKKTKAIGCGIKWKSK